MDKQIVAQKLESLRKCLLRIQDKSPEDAELLVNNIDLQDIIALNLSRAVQLSVDISAHLVSELNLAVPNTMGKVFDTIAEAGIISSEVADSLKKAVGFRNIAVHNYERINCLIVHAITHKNLADFKTFAKQISAYIDQK